ncbi:hypothetical protein DFP72DRAFT_1034925 [Ephemerocybe angulata]|uniref:mRNA 3'-end-processing protein RNA14 n=1 Tax=Ephemerocybe angulata TaxID=980116 RepID=A0A8H6HK88_9AGAR|nr:hypothetical protein DFP72DRAFT_1034925 [Tulosesus angulatus]
MDEPAQNEDIALDGDQTQPTAEIIAAMNQNGSTNTIKTEPDTDGPTSEFDALFARLSENPQDPEGWRRLIDLATGSGEIPKIQQAFDELLKHYPNTSSAQIAYISHFLNDESTFAEAEQLFIKFLRSSPNVDLWKFYLTYVRRRNTGPSASTREIVRKSYEFALNHVGQDKDSGEIWNDYIQFLKAGDASSTWEEQQKMDTLRKAYHRAVQIPLDNLEKLWSELETFETNLNKITAKKFMSDLSPAHTQARAVLRQLTTHLNPLYPPQQGNDLYLPTQPAFDNADRILTGKWKAYLKWEESNPLEIEEKDKATLVTRLQGVYRKAVIRMRFHSEIWYMAYAWTSSVGKQDEAIAILKAGFEANPSSYLLAFAYAEAMELKKEYPEVHSTFNKIIAVRAKHLEELAKTNPPEENGAKEEPASQSTNSSFGSQAAEEKPTKLSEYQEWRRDYGIAYIMYMRFARRCEGLPALRKIFLRARKDKLVPWEVYEATALMEYHGFGDKQVATRIFERGLDTFPAETDFVCRYLGFLISVNDGNNARALFERVIQTFPSEKARPLWERWARYENQHGDLEAILKLEKRIAEAYPKEPPMKRFAQRHMHLNIDAIADCDLGMIARRHSTNVGAVLGRNETGQSITPAGANAPKRPASPDHNRGVKREDTRNFEAGGGGGYKRQRGNASPARVDRDVHMRDRDRDHDRGRDAGRDRWTEGGNKNRRFSPPPPSGGAWERERDDRDGGRGYGGPSRDIKREESFAPRGPPPVQIPPVVSWFVGELPPAATFDGPVFKTDDLMKCFKQAIIPSSVGAGPNGAPPPRARTPPPPPGPTNYSQHRGGGRPPPDYGPYTGPGGGGGRGRRY